MNIIIAAHYNLNNGDRALLEATIRIFNEILPDSTLTVSAYKPELLNDKRFNVVGWPLRNGKYEKFMLKCSKFDYLRKFFRKHYRIFCDSEYLKSLEASDIVFLSGGHHLTDILSAANYYKLSSNFYVPIAMGKRVVMLPQSIGPSSDKGVTESIKYILQNITSVAYRDESSNSFIESLNIACNKQYVPDLVFSLKPRKKDIAAMKTVGVALYHGYAGENRERILPFTIKNLKLIIDNLLKRGYSVRIIPMDMGDEEIFCDIKNCLKYNNKEKMFTLGSRGNNILELIEEFNSLSFVLAYKTHSTVFSMICNTPLIAIAYHPKSVEFMEKVGLVEYTINDTEASFENLIKLIDKLEKNINRVKEAERLGVENNRAIIKKYIWEMLK